MQAPRTSASSATSARRSFAGNWPSNLACSAATGSSNLSTSARPFAVSCVATWRRSIVLRSRKLMREKIKALSAEATTSAGIIGSLPPGVTAMITFSSPTYMSVMYTDPRGHMMLGGGLIWMCLGVFVMKKMINFKF